MSQQKTVLVVDDESSLVQLCLIVLEGAGFKVRGAYSGRQALRMITEEIPDLVLLDVMMPGMNGIEVCREIRSSYQSHRPCIIMYTADSSDATKRSSLAAGANALLTKEIPIYDLPARIRTFLVPN
ncbi:MAG: response regulator [Chloroflexi bacterium]|nr:response regulator [Chloroflexota bacterium]MCI0574795.1 response regulator [Chloroflexota bacterium]MCI0649816.1 response regulator [Chloroflexota bacterium]MCI0731059.1 response regulator [Chloroflexota bacterium]